MKKNITIQQIKKSKRYSKIEKELVRILMYQTNGIPLPSSPKLNAKDIKNNFKVFDNYASLQTIKMISEVSQYIKYDSSNDEYDDSEYESATIKYTINCNYGEITDLIIAGERIINPIRPEGIVKNAKLNPLDYSFRLSVSTSDERAEWEFDTTRIILNGSSKERELTQSPHTGTGTKVDEWVETK